MQCKTLLTEKKKEVGIIAEELLAKAVLARDNLVRLLGPRPWEERGEFSKYFGGEPMPRGPTTVGPDRGGECSVGRMGGYRHR